MSRQNAIDFLSKIQVDTMLRKAMYGCSSKDDLHALLKSYGFVFSEDEFQDAVNGLLLRCTTESQAYSLQELKNWFALVETSKR